MEKVDAAQLRMVWGEKPCDHPGSEDEFEAGPVVERELAEQEPHRKSGAKGSRRAPALKVAADYVKVLLGSNSLTKEGR